MRKIESNHENPIDDIFLHITEIISPFLYTTGHTPNIITTYSFISGLISLYYLYAGNTIYFAFYYILGYFFDCVDGYFARRYSMTSKYGDLYDHFTDLVVNGAIYFYIFNKVRDFKTLTPLKISLVIGLLVLSYLSFTHIGCQQKMLEKEVPSGLPTPPVKVHDESLDILQKLCPDKNSITLTRFFGTGTLNLYIAVILGAKLI
jgi:phosphatidylserine synthase